MHFRPVLALLTLTALASNAHAEGLRHPGTPAKFAEEVKILYRVAACGAGELPAGFDAATVEKHCKALDAAKAQWKKKWLDIATPFFAELFKGGYPEQAVYPFGGGDLLTFLGVYPNAREYTTLSLEGMGDPRPIKVLAGKPAKQQDKRLAGARAIAVGQLKMAWNTTIQLSKDSNARGEDVLPVVLVQTLTAMAVHGYEPVEAHYFKIDEEGVLVYLRAEDVAAWDKSEPAAEAAQRKKKAADENVLQVGAFTNVEITFRKIGDPNAPLKTFRHIAADLSDGGLSKTPGPLLHLKQKKEIAAMTKAASYLLWYKSFGQIRDYLLAHMKLMVSDDTGIPPRYAKPAGFVQETWGKFLGAYFGYGGADVQRELVQLWKTNPQRPLPFRFGYYDNKRNPHLLFTHK
jgi:hypothetical protein